MSVSIKLDMRKLQQLEREAPGRAKKVLMKIGFDVERVVKQSFTTSPSAPGEPPGVDTGLLKNSIHVEDVGPLAIAVVART